MGKTYGLKVNVGKIKLMAIRNSPPIIAQLQIDTVPIEQVRSFEYLKMMLNGQWDHQQEMKCRT